MFRSVNWFQNQPNRRDPGTFPMLTNILFQRAPRSFLARALENTYSTISIISKSRTHLFVSWTSLKVRVISKPFTRFSISLTMQRRSLLSWPPSASWLHLGMRKFWISPRFTPCKTISKTWMILCDRISFSQKWVGLEKSSDKRTVLNIYDGNREDSSISFSEMSSRRVLRTR